MIEGIILGSSVISFIDYVIPALFIAHKTQIVHIRHSGEISIIFPLPSMLSFSYILSYYSPGGCSWCFRVWGDIAMKFITATTLVLGPAFYQLSGGNNFEPRTREIQTQEADADPIKTTQAPVFVAKKLQKLMWLK